ncbi:MAG: PilZ domain-containing protein [candidate division NC10 bacterium]
MKKRLGQVSRTKLEDICVSIREIKGTPHVDLRIYRRSARLGGDGVGGMEGIAVPLNLLPDLLRVLDESQERLAQEMLRRPRSHAKVTKIEADEPEYDSNENNNNVAPPRRLLGDRRGRRVPLRVPIECRHWPAVDYYTVTGETEDVSVGGAQIWLPERFPLLSPVAVSMNIAGRLFQLLAEIVGVGVRQRHGRFRHSLRWLGLNAQAKAALSQVIPGI